MKTEFDSCIRLRFDVCYIIFHHTCVRLELTNQNNKACATSLARLINFQLHKYEFDML